MLRSLTRPFIRGTQHVEVYSTRAHSYPTDYFAPNPWKYVNQMEGRVADLPRGQTRSTQGRGRGGHPGGKPRDDRPEGSRPGGNRRGGRRDDDPRVVLSKTMSSVLRHNADKFGLKMRSDGYAKVQDLLALPKFRGQTYESIKAVVDADEKKRYDLREEDGTWFIRANQGHSMTTVKVEMEEMKDPACVPMVVHGTTQHAWKSISTQGLSRMNRQHIHFAQGLPNDEGVISGMRKSCSVLVFVDLAKAMRAGHTFYLSKNGVVLTAGDEHGFLTPDFFSRVEATKTGQPIDGFDGPRQPIANASAEEARPTSKKTILAAENVLEDEDREAAEEAWSVIAEQKGTGTPT